MSLEGHDYEPVIEKIDEVITDIGRDIISGNIQARPSRYGNEEACEYCDFRQACFFDEKLSGCEYHSIRKIKNSRGKINIWDLTGHPDKKE